MLGCRSVRLKVVVVAVLLAMAGVSLFAETATDPAWGFSFTVPSGWKGQKDANGAILGHEAIAGIIIVFPHEASTMQEMRSRMEAGLNVQGFQLALAGSLTTLGKNILAGECEGYANGEPVKGKTLGALSPYGGGAYVIALSTPQGYNKDLAATAEKIASGMQFPKTDTAALVRALTGTWVTMSANSQSQFTLGSDGRFSEYSESTYSGSSNDQYGNEVLNWGTGGNQQSAGKWTARGTKEGGTIILTYDSGERSSYQFSVHVENGKTYWNEYYFGGKLYSRSQ